jgi:hypothetical protein
VGLLLEKNGDQVPITKKVLKAVIGSIRTGQEIMALLLEKRRTSLDHTGSSYDCIKE